MPRLVGKQSNKATYIVLIFFVAIMGFFGLEYSGVCNVIPGFGKEPSLVKQ